MNDSNKKIQITSGDDVAKTDKYGCDTSGSQFNNTNLVIKNVTFEDSGVYICDECGRAGIEMAAQLSVLCKYI